MRSRWTALLGVLVLAGLTSQTADTQGGPPQTPPRKAAMGQNFPNPFNPSTKIPLTIGDAPTCSEGSSKRYVVSLRIYNTIQQLVAIPVIQGGSGDVAGGRQINKLLLGCGQYMSYWDGKDSRNRKEVASGMYIAELVVDGQKSTIRMQVAK